MTVPATSGGELVKLLRYSLGNYTRPERGNTKFVEAAGGSVMRGIAKDDPFIKQGCDFGDQTCIVGPGCRKVSQTYKVLCETCDPQQQQQPRDHRRRPQAAQVVAGSRRVRYIGQTGTSLHWRQSGHKADKGSALTKHKQAAHGDHQQPPASYRMRPIRGSKTVLHRLITEGVCPHDEDQLHPGALMNSR